MQPALDAAPRRDRLRYAPAPPLPFPRGSASHHPSRAHSRGDAPDDEAEVRSATGSCALQHLLDRLREPPPIRLLDHALLLAGSRQRVDAHLPTFIGFAPRRTDQTAV